MNPETRTFILFGGGVFWAFLATFVVLSL